MRRTLVFSLVGGLAGTWLDLVRSRDRVASIVDRLTSHCEDDPLT